MLAYILAVLVGAGSVGLYATAFLLPEIHRKNDFIWSGVGLFYALFLWLYAHQVTGGILVGQTSSVLLMGWFAWQIVKMRRQLVAIERQASITTPNKAAEPVANRSSSAPKAAKPPAKTQSSAKTAPPSVPPAKAPGASVAANTTPPAPTPSRQSQPPVQNQIPLSEVRIPPARVPVVPEATKVPPQSVVSQPQTPLKQTVTPPPNNRSSNTSQNPAAPKSEPVANIPPTTPTAPKSESVANIPPTTPTAPKSEPVANIPPTTPTAPKSEPVANIPSITSEQPEDEAWIQLELQPSSSKPLGGAVKPPTPSSPDTPKSSAIVPETVSQNIPTDATQTTVKVEQPQPD